MQKNGEGNCRQQLFKEHSILFLLLNALPFRGGKCLSLRGRLAMLAWCHSKNGSKLRSQLLQFLRQLQVKRQLEVKHQLQAMQEFTASKNSKIRELRSNYKLGSLKLM